MFLAPIAGYSNSPMRRISHRYGAAMSYTEMASVTGLLHPDAKKTWGLLETTKNEGPVVAHLFGTEPDEFAEAAVRIEQTKRFVAIDLNAGCPAKRITDQGAGSELIKTPQRIHDIIAAMKKAVALPITVKTRLGSTPDRIAAFEVLAAAEAAGASALTIHGRFASQGHRGEANIKLIGEVKRRAKIPIIGNGDVHSRYSAWHMFEETEVDAIMIARAAVANPWIFEDLRMMFATQVKPVKHSPTHIRPRREIAVIATALESHLKLEQDHLQLLYAKYGIPETGQVEEALVHVFRYHLFRYLRGLKGSAGVRRQLCDLNTLDAVRETVKGCFEREEAYRAREKPPKAKKKRKKKVAVAAEEIPPRIGQH
ncbi:MAG: tRNA-dihydrouridine synthase family protein [Kiritimatiellaeota bacterium]|nr:tRNA-dihydrouridine synthase family protein [Kiritimatiellota bacterium]